MVQPISIKAVMTARRALNQNLAGLFRATTRLATGRKINSGRDDPAGLIVSERLAAEIKSLQAETRSLQRAGSFANITEGHASQLSSLMGDLNGLLVSSANTAWMSDEEIAANQMQIDSIVARVQTVSQDTVTSLDGVNMPGTGNTDVENAVTSAATAVSSLRSGGANSLASGDFAAAQAAIQGAISSVATARGRIGTFQKYNVEPSIRSNQIALENISASKSRIADTDFAEETSNLTRFSILAASSMMALKIAQQQGNAVLSLLK